MGEAGEGGGGGGRDQISMFNSNIILYGGWVETIHALMQGNRYHEICHITMIMMDIHQVS